MEKRYIVSDWTIDGDCDIYLFTTAEEANQRAEMLWDHLTAREKKKRHIFASVVTSDQLDPYNVKEYGEEDAWRMISDLDDFPGRFDSDDEN